MANQFEGKAALITGAAAGIGEATALAFSREGAAVVVADVQIEKGQAVAKQISASGGRAIFVRCDVRSEQDIQKAVSSTVDTFGQIDFAFNNAGIGGAFGTLTDLNNETWDNVINTDLRGVWLCMKYEILQMLRQGHGAIVNCASTCGLVGVAGLSAYVAAKHGVVGLTKSAALEFATRNIRINAVCPGTIFTASAEEKESDFVADPEERAKVIADFISVMPINRWGRTEEVASAVTWLCSPGAGLMLGHALAVDGGWTAR